MPDSSEWNDCNRTEFMGAEFDPETVPYRLGQPWGAYIIAFAYISVYWLSQLMASVSSGKINSKK